MRHSKMPIRCAEIEAMPKRGTEPSTAPKARVGLRREMLDLTDAELRVLIQRCVDSCMDSTSNNKKDEVRV